MYALYMTEVLSETFWIAFIATVSTMFGLSLRMCLRSRCDVIQLGCIRKHRAVDLEAQEAMRAGTGPNATMDDLYRSESKENIRL